MLTELVHTHFQPSVCPELSLFIKSCTATSHSASPSPVWPCSSHWRTARMYDKHLRALVLWVLLPCSGSLHCCWILALSMCCSLHLEPSSSHPSFRALTQHFSALPAPPNQNSFLSHMLAPFSVTVSTCLRLSIHLPGGPAVL